MNEPTALSQLRHLYQNMVNGAVRDTASAKRIAEGLLAPAIAALERGTPQPTQPPAVAGEPVGWMWQHDETGRTGFVDCWQVENGWQENNPRLRLVSKLYTTPQPTQAQAGAVPMPRRTLLDMTQCYSDRETFGRAVEAWHGIKGGQS